MSSATLDWLPYIDAPITDAERAAAEALIASEVSKAGPGPAQHPSMRDLPQLTPTPFGADLISRASKGEKIAAIDMSRYEGDALEPPSSAPNDPEHLRQWKDSLNRAATLHSYLTLRGQNLALLDTYGKNAWLIANDNAENALRALEKTLVESKEQLDQAETLRRLNQEASKAEFGALQAEWRQRVVAKMQTEVATAELREQIAALRAD